MKFNLYSIALLLLSSISLHTSANSFGVPERPQNLAPADLASEVSVLPTLTSSAFEVNDDSNNPIGSAVHTESEWLVYIENGVTLVGGTNLTGMDRANTQSITFNVSSATLRLSGSGVQYAVINHKRLELQDSSNNILGYVELPSFFWQSENKDIYGAARLKIFSDAVAVEWHYGDDMAATPWNMKLQAILKNNELGVKFDNVSFSAGFIAAHGSNSVSLCDEALCYDHSLSNVFNTGNTIVCGLSDLVSDCANASLYTGGVLDDLNINAVAQGTSLNTNFNVQTDLMDMHTYSWVVRHSGTIDDVTVITGGWSNASSFTTANNQSPVDTSLISVTLNNPPVEFAESARFSIDVANYNGHSSVSGLVLTANYEGYGNGLNYPSECLINDISAITSELTCTLDLAPNEIKQLSFTINADQPTEHLSFSFDASYESSYITAGSFDGINVRSLDALTEYAIGTNLKAEYTLDELKASPITLSIVNVSDTWGRETVANITWAGSAEVRNSGNASCSTVESSTLFTRISCVMNETRPDEHHDFELSLKVESRNDDLSLSMTVEICENLNCNGSGQRYEQYTLISGSGEEDGGGSLWLLPLLGLLLRRKL